MTENYQDEFIEIYRKIRANTDEKPKLLVHVCCGACSCYPLIYLTDLFDVTVLFTNSNISTFEEYKIRFEAAKKHSKYLKKSLNTDISLIFDDYRHDEFFNFIKAYPNEKEGGRRCKICIAKRLERVFEYAKENHFEYVTSIMSISRNKDAKYLNDTGKNLAKKYNGITYVPFDFKKGNGQDIGVEISKLENIYRQDYCGCEFSEHNTD